MKHPTKLTTILIIFFIVSQVLGLYIVSQNIDFKKSVEMGETKFVDLPSGLERPEVNESYSWIYIAIGILLGTVLLLVLIKFKLLSLWKFWFFLAVFFCLYVALATFVGNIIAGLISLLLAYFKIVKPNTYIHNLTELFIYAGLAVIFVPILNRTSVIILLLLISVYDMYAVWKSKHMIKLAKFQTDSKVFAGFFIPYSEGKIVNVKHVKVSKKVKSAKGKRKKSLNKQKINKTRSSDVQSAILGGGDIAFPLLFAGVMMKYVVVETYLISFLKILIIPLCATIALGGLFYYTKKNRFYPAMPFITVGCFIGYGLFLLL
tara:strand:+ start:12344 stop:13300 length:957 start_codon:yes stop_codon:yes gene_type:complete